MKVFSNGAKKPASTDGREDAAAVPPSAAKSAGQLARLLGGVHTGSSVAPGSPAAGFPKMSETLPAQAAARAGRNPATESVPWETALAELDRRHTRALAAQNETHQQDLARLAARLADAERATADLGSQVRDLR